MNKAYLESGEIIRMVETADNLRDRLLITMLFHLGCRISEALAIKAGDIDLANRTITITHLKSRIKLKCRSCGTGLSRASVFCPKCGSKVCAAEQEFQEKRKQRVLPIDDTLVEIVSEYISRDGPINRNGKRLIFGINRHRAWQIIKECADKAGLPKIINTETGKIHNVSPHRLRDAFAVHAVKLDDSGDGLRMLQEHLGHQNFNTTARYRKVSGEEHKRWYQKMWDKGNSNGSFT